MNKYKVARVRMPEELINEIDRLAKETERDRSKVIRLAVKKYLKGGAGMKVAEVQSKVQNIVSFIFKEHAERYTKEFIAVRPDLIIENITKTSFNFYKKEEGFDDYLESSYEVSGSFKYENNGIIIYFRFIKNQKLHEYQAAFKLDDEEIDCKPSRRYSDPEAELKELTYTEK